MSPRRSSPKVRRGRATKHGLVYVNSTDDWIRRERVGKKKFGYLTPSGRSVTAKRTLSRIETLAIPPAWTEVAICPRPQGHLQAVGIDDAGRRQYLYHPRWHEIQTATKFHRMEPFGGQLPCIRRRVRRDLRRKRLSKSRVLAAVVRLLDKAHLRVGSRQYLRDNASHGVTTLFPEHVEVAGSRIWLEYPGKSGKQREVTLSDPKVAAVIQDCGEVTGQFLFQYLDDRNESHTIDSGDVNEYLRSICDIDDITSKDFRTWWGSVVALAELKDLDETTSTSARRREVGRAVGVAAETLGNTKAVCRSSYIHPGILSAAISGKLPLLLRRIKNHCRREMTLDECRFLELLPLLATERVPA